MSTTTADTQHADQQRRHERHIWWWAYALMVGGGLFIAAFSRQRITTPFLGLTLGVLLVLLLGWLIRPRATLYATIFLTAVSDIVTVSWFPFVKNFSSRESISFVSDALTVSPLELSLGIGFAVTALREYATSGRLMKPSPMTAPVLVFTGFVAFGFVRGVLLAGGDLRIAVLEGRSIFFLALVFGIAVNICTEPAHLRNALWWALAGIVAQTLLSLEFHGRLSAAEADALESLNEHGSALGHNLIIVTLLGLVLFRCKAAIPRLLLAIAAVPTVVVYLISQRRAGVAALAVAILLMLIMLFWRRRHLFWVVTPILTVVVIGYLGAFWNSESSAGFPAQAIKSIIAPGSASAEDQSSDLYRLIEAFDLNFTIRTDPLKGLGFGQAFYRPVPLPDISFFELNAYLPHNSVLWIWIKTGFGGFAAMFYLFGKTVMLGARRARRLPDGVDVVVTMSGLLFVVMYAIYTYVDVSWDARNMVFLGLATAICARPLAPDRRASGVDEPTSTAEPHDDGAERTSDTTFATNSA